MRSRPEPSYQRFVIWGSMHFCCWEAAVVAIPPAVYGSTPAKVVILLTVLLGVVTYIGAGLNEDPQAVP